MRKMRKLWLWLLCVAMIVMLCACGDTGKDTQGDTSSETGTQNESNTASSEEDAERAAILKKYEDALVLLDEMKSMKLEITSTRTTVLGTDQFNEESTQTVILEQIGDASFAAEVKDKTIYGTYYVHTEEIFSGGNMYYSITPIGTTEKQNYKTEMTAEAYLDRLIPARLLDAALYENVEQASVGTIAFSEGTDIEAWLGVEGANVRSAEGTVQFGENGAIANSKYNLIYEQNSAVITLTISVKISSETGEEIKVPESTDAYQVLEGENYYGPYLVHHAIGYTIQMDSVTSYGSETALSMAAGLMYTQDDSVHLYSDNQNKLANMEYVAHLADLNTGETYFNDTVTETFKDGIYTYIYNDELPESQSINYSMVAGSVVEGFAGNFANVEDMESFTVGNYGGTLLIEYDYAEELDKDMAQHVAGKMLADPTLLDTLATAYRTEESCGYIGIDLATGIPTAHGMDFTGIHTIDGVEYALTYAYSQNYLIGSTSTYEEITGEALPEQVGEVEEITPVFYHVTGADGQEMWLLGTIHVGDYRTGKLPASITDAFAASDALAVEFDTNAFEEQLTEDSDLALQVYALYFYSDGSTAESHISDPELYEYALKQMKASGLAGPYTEQMKVAVWSMDIDNYNQRWDYTLSSDYGMDSRLLDMAEDQNKKILDVESGMEQLQMLTGFSDKLQELLLGSSLSTTISEYNTDAQNLYEMWCRGDEAELIAYLNDDSDTSDMTAEELALYEEYVKDMETDRNLKMLNVAKDYLESDEVVFYAVGLAHLLAEDGLVNTLREAGYTVELVQ